MSDQPIDIQQLVALASGELEPDDAKALHARLDASPELREAYLRLVHSVAFLRAEPEATPSDRTLAAAKRLLRDARPGLIDRLEDGLSRLIASLDFDTRLTPAVAGIRGASAAAQVAFSSEAADLDIEITPSSDERWIISAQIDADEDGDWRVTIVDRATDAPVEELNATDGAFRATLEAGSYTLRFLRGSVEIEAGPLQIP